MPFAEDTFQQAKHSTGWRDSPPFSPMKTTRFPYEASLYDRDIHRENVYDHGACKALYTVTFSSAH
jgi:hypothetical protein